MNPKQRALLPGFAGVALADILANSVAIIIIMIVVTGAIKHEQEKGKLEQVEDVSVVLSRDLATSVVMNSLPSSPPVRLHHYNLSPLDRNPQHALMPILEMHSDYVRHYYSGEIITRNQLLLHDNALDRYLRSLTTNQRQRIRMDIYDIRLFYIVMSIMKKYGSLPGHWHFLKYPKNYKPATKTLMASGPENEKESASERKKAGDEDSKHENKPDESLKRPPGAGEWGGRSYHAQADEHLKRPPGAEGDSGRSNTVPQQVSLFNPAQSNENYPYDDLAFKSGPPGDAAENPDLPGSISETGPFQRQSDSIFDALARMMEDKLEENNPAGRNRTTVSRFRSANPETAGETIPFPNQNLVSTQALDFQTILRPLFAFMERLQSEADAGKPTALAKYNFSRDILALIPKLAPLTDADKASFFRTLTTAISNPPGEERETIFVNQRTEPKVQGKVLMVPVNRRMHRLLVLNDADQEKEPTLPDEVRITGRLSLYPEIYRGLRMPLKENALLLMPQQQKEPEQFRWRVVTAVSPTADDFVTAFVYAAVDPNGWLMLAVEQNGVKISDLRISPNYPPLPLRRELWQIITYGLVAAFFVFGILRRVPSLRSGSGAGR